MIFLHTLLLAVALLTSMQESFREYRMQVKAYALYGRHAWREAESAYEELVTLPLREKERATASFNLACALYMQGKFPDAATLISNSAKPGRMLLEMRQRDIFNECNALAMRAIGDKAKAQKIVLFRQSLNRFKTVLLTEPGDGDAKINYEVVARYLRELERTEKESSPPPASSVKNNVADRLLDNAQQDESSLMQRPPPTRASAKQGSKNSKDW